MPLLPSWMGALAGAAAFGTTTTYNRPESITMGAVGDLSRTMGMRVSQLARIGWQTQAELRVLPQSAAVATKILDKLLVLDRKHSIRNRIVTMLGWMYDQGRNAANQMQQQSSLAPSDQQRPPRRQGPGPPRRRYDNNGDGGDSQDGGGSYG